MLSSFVLLQGLLITAASASGFPFFKKIPVEYTNPRDNPHPSCPLDTHILGHGTADSAEEARKAARADVVRQIRSSISTLAQRVSNAQQAGKHSSSSTTLTQTITEESDFSYAEKIVDIGKIHKKKKKHYALACLDKKESALYIYEQVKEDISRLSSVLDTTHQFFTEEDRVGFTAEYFKTKTLYQAQESDLILIRTLHEHPAVMGAVAKYNRFQKEADLLSSSMRLGVFSNHAPSQAELVSTITKSNRTAFASSSGCSEDQTHHVSLKTTPLCKKKMGNHFCTIDITYSVRDCKQKRDYTQQFINSIVGADSRSKERALERAYQQLRIQNYDSQIQESFRIFTPQQEE